MTRRDFEIRAAKFFLMGDNIKEQLNILENVQFDDHHIEGIYLWEAFENLLACDLRAGIQELADDYEEFYNMTNEQFRDE